MDQPIRHQRTILDRRSLAARLATLNAAELGADGRRRQALELVKEAYRQGYAELRRRFEGNGDGIETARETCFLVDQLVRVVHDFVLASDGLSGIKDEIAVLAVGGYGRGELAPHSDVDLLFLMPKQRGEAHEKVVQDILYLLWDTGLKVGHSTRTIEECLREGKADFTIRTALLELRWLWGDQKLYKELVRRFRSDLASGTEREFVEAKLAERDGRHDRLGDARYVLEPNIKDGKGGLRDLHTLTWIAKYIYNIADVRGLVPLGLISEDAAARFAKAQSFLWTVRCHLHFITDRMEDRLTFGIQPEIAARMHYADRGGTRGVERFMKHYYLIAKDVGDLTRIFCALLEEQHKRRPRLRLGGLFGPRELDGFRIEANRLEVRDEEEFIRDPVRMIRIFHTALETDYEIHPHALSLINRNLKRIDAKLRADPEANRLFVEMLTSRKDPERALRAMNEAGVLGRFIPDFGRVVAQMQYDMYHVYTVDEHTIRAVGIVHQYESGSGPFAESAPVANEVMRTNLSESSRRALYVAVFLHDIAKGRKGDHSELGAAVALKLGPRFGLSDEEVEMTSWLVRYHLLMTRIAFKRDLDDRKTIADFIAIVQSPERLKLLVALTAADVTAVGPGIFNGWKAGLLGTLYHQGQALMTGGLGAERRRDLVESAKSKLRAKLKGIWSDAEISAHLAAGYPSYWVNHDENRLLRQALLMREARATGAPLTVDSKVIPSQAVTEVTIYTADHAGLFSRIAGAMALSGASIVDADITTMADGMALDTFYIQDAAGEAFSGPSQLAKMAVNIERSLEGRLSVSRELAKRRAQRPSKSKVFGVPPRVIVDNAASSTATVIEVNGGDRIGLLYDLTADLTRLNLQIASSHISTYGERVVDVFYVKDLFGLKVEHPRRVREIRDALLAVLREPATPAPETLAAQ